MFWKLGKSRVDPDSAWKLQNQEQQDNPVYRYVNLQKEGRLIEVYNQHGPAAVETVVRHELESFLYDGGKGKTVTKIEFIKWKYRCLTKTNVSRSDVLGFVATT